jgi:hypothetical protein
MKYTTNLNGRLFELNSNVPLSDREQQAEVQRYLQGQPAARKFPLMTVAGTRTRTGRT